MTSNIWSILCKEIINDSRTNQHSYINCIEEIEVSKLPSDLGAFYIGTLWVKSSNDVEDLKLRFTRINPSGSKEHSFVIDNIRMGSKRHRVNVAVGEFKIKEEGTYRIIIESFNNEKWNIEKEIPFDVRLNKSVIKHKKDKES